MCIGKHVTFTEIPAPCRKICRFSVILFFNCFTFFNCFFTHLVFKIMERISLKVVTNRPGVDYQFNRLQLQLLTGFIITDYIMITQIFNVINYNYFCIVIMNTLRLHVITF